MTQTTRLILKDLPQGKATRLQYEPSADLRADIAATLDITVLKKLRFQGKLQPGARSNWTLTGTLGATVVQPCRVTLEPVTTRIEETVERRYIADFASPEESEAEMMPEDDSTEPLPTEINLGELVTEALALAIPVFPRSETAQDATSTAAPPGAAPLTEEALNPFAALAEFRATLPDSDAPDEDT